MTDQGAANVDSAAQTAPTDTGTTDDTAATQLDDVTTTDKDGDSTLGATDGTTDDQTTVTDGDDSKLVEGEDPYKGMNPEQLVEQLRTRDKSLNDTKAWATKLSQDNATRTKTEAEAKATEAATRFKGQIKTAQDGFTANLEALKDSHGEDSFEYGLAAQNAEAMGVIFNALEGLEETTQNVQALENAKTMEIGLISKHPDAPDILKEGSERNKLLETFLTDPSTPRGFAQLMVSKDLGNVAFVLDTFKTWEGLHATGAARAAREASNTQRLKDTQPPGGSPAAAPTSTKKWTREEIGKLSPEDYRKYEADIDRAIAAREVD